MLPGVSIGRSSSNTAAWALPISGWMAQPLCGSPSIAEATGKPTWAKSAEAALNFFGCPAVLERTSVSTILPLIDRPGPLPIS